MKVTLAEVLTWQEAYEAGATIEEIALDAGRCHQTVRKHLTATGTSIRPPGQRKGTCVKNRANHVPTGEPSTAVRVPFAGTRGAHRRRGGKVFV